MQHGSVDAAHAAQLLQYFFALLGGARNYRLQANAASETCARQLLELMAGGVLVMGQEWPPPAQF